MSPKPILSQVSFDQAETEDPTEDMFEREFARRYHLDFIKRLWIAENAFIPGWHIDVICKRIDQAIIDYREGKSTFLIIKVPFRHSKSTIISKYLPAHFIGLFPDSEIIVATYTASLAREFSRFARDKVMRSEEYMKMFPEAKLSEREQSVDMWGIEGRQGKVRWLGLGGSITGKGGSLTICDDFFKGRKEANSEILRDAVWDSIGNDLLTRRPDPSIVIILATPWHMDDPFGRIANMMKQDPMFPVFEEIKFPARDPSYNQGFLWPEKFGKAWYESQFATLGPYYSSALLQCEPVPRGGSMFKVDNVKRYTVAPDDIVWTRGWDLASSEKSRISPDPDYTVGIKLGVKWVASGVEGQNIPILYIDDMIRGRWEALQRKSIIRDTAIGDGDINVGIEAFGAYKDAFTEAVQILNGLRVVKSVHLPGDKVTKWAPIESACAAGNVFIKEAPWNQDFLDEMATAPDGKHDDIPDSIITAFSMHGSYLKQVWPSFRITKQLPITIEWEKAGPYTSFNYAAISLQKDFSIYFVAALWDNFKSQLSIYACKTWPNCNEESVIRGIGAMTKSEKYRVDKLMGSENMFSINAFEKSPARQLNHKIRELNTNDPVTIKEPIHYNSYGAIQIGEELFRTNGILISDKCSDVSRQILGWTLKNGKPSEEDWGYCECLCLILSELQRKKVVGTNINKTSDYRNVDEKKKIY